MSSNTNSNRNSNTSRGGQPPEQSVATWGTGPNWLVRQRAHVIPLTPIKGFEQTHYASLGGRIVWIGDDAAVRHPRNYWKPWQPPKKTYSAALLQAGARLCLQQIDVSDDAQGLLAWLLKRELAFPLNHAKLRFDDLRVALQAKRSKAFEAAALGVLGLGNGLTPSGDDFVGGIFFAYAHACKPSPDWLASLSTLQATISKACETSTNPISAALLADNMAGASFGELHDMLDAFESNDSRYIESALQALLRLGSSSGADLLAGLLLALTIL
ncbi:MAG: DUF2877 domain-containing protein [Cytophagales bacterium]|nr:DUF2877 domain-containing protein [Cytophagales bacterium]